MANRLAPNRLSKETSPYLLQHANNPVDWYPWGEDALDLAVEENKPILLSIGYSACHWCHVMERESFENEEIARLMNENFICIKVDREERPDLDQIYQNVAQALTHGGGWPLTVFLTPARKPFFGGTYFPPEDSHGRAGFKRVLVALSKAYRTDPIGVAQNAMKLSAYISAAEGSSGERADARRPDFEALSRAAQSILNHVDPANGGIGDAPKFPNVMTFSYLWRFGILKKSEAAKQAVLLTLRKMAEGGIYDQLGGGFSRYSVDATWSVPHFEKMLYDNGLLLTLYSEVLLSGDPSISAEDRSLFLDVLKDTLSYLFREMVSPEGGFYAAQDADSEGKEGKFFVWDPKELDEVLPDAQEKKIFSLRYGVSEEGNFEHGKTVLYLARSLEEVSETAGVSVDQARETLGRAKVKVFKARAERIPPGTDNKILASWNGLMISGLCWASRALRGAGLTEEAGRALDAALRAFSLVSEKMTSGQDGKLSSTYQGGNPRFNAYLDDYAFMAQAALDVARVLPESRESPGSPVSGETLSVKRALQLASLWTKRIVRRFKDEAGPGYFFTSDDHETLINRPKSIYDQATPSGISVTLSCLVALAEIGEEGAEGFSAELERQLFALFPEGEKNPFGCAELLSAALLYQVGPVVVSGPGTEQASVNPFVFRKPGDKSGQRLVCHRGTCDAPFASAKELLSAALSKVAGTPAVGVP